MGRDESRPCICAAAGAIWNHDVHNSMSRRVIGCLSWSASNQKGGNCKDRTEQEMFVRLCLLRHYATSIRISVSSYSGTKSFASAIVFDVRTTPISVPRSSLETLVSVTPTGVKIRKELGSAVGE